MLYFQLIHLQHSLRADALDQSEVMSVPARPPACARRRRRSGAEPLSHARTLDVMQHDGIVIR